MDLYNMRKEITNGKTIYDLPLKVTYYARVSSEKDEQLNSLSNQVFYFENHIKKIDAKYKNYVNYEKGKRKKTYNRYVIKLA